MLHRWEKLPDLLKKDSIKPYYEYLRKKQFALFCKRFLDILFSLVLLLLCSPVMLLLLLLIPIDSPGNPLFLQERVTKNGKIFKIIKFRTMISNALEHGPEVTTKQDARITRIGKFIRKVRLDEIPQLINVLCGDMTFVGTRPEVPSYVKAYQEEMYATLLLPAGVTSFASIKYKEEQQLLDEAKDPEKIYVEKILPGKMILNFDYLLHFSLLKDFQVILATVKAVFFS